MKVCVSLALVVLLLWVLSACQDIPSSSKPVIETVHSGGTVTRAITSEPTSLDPHGAAGSGQNAILPYLFDTLVYRDVDNTFKPYLAERWEVTPDGKEITFHLRKGVIFHDGTALDAQAVVFTFERFKEKGIKSPLAAGIEQIEKIEALNTQAVHFILKHPSSTFFSTLSMPYAGILSPTAARKMQGAFGQAPVGSGPFRFGEWRSGVSITLERNPDYHWGIETLQNKGAPLINKAVFKILPDATTQLSALQTGEIDVLFVNQPEHVRKVEALADVQHFAVQLNSLVYVNFQCQKAPLDDVRVRQALAHAIQKEDILKAALDGVGETAFAPLTPNLPGFSKDLKQYEREYDPSQTQALLKQAGFVQKGSYGWERDGMPLELTLLTSTRAPNPAIATMLQSQFKAVGVTVEIQQMDATAVIEAATYGKFDLLLWRYDWNDADVLNVYLSSSRIGSTNRAFYSNPALDALLSQAMREMDDEARKALYFEAQKIILEEAPWQPLYVPKDVLVVRNRVQNLSIGYMGRIWLNDALVK